MPRLFTCFFLLCCIACSPVDALNVFVPSDTYHRVQDVAYGKLERQKLDIYTPSAPAKGPRDVVIFVYGGSWQMGSRDKYVFAAEAFARRGFITVVPDYRLAPEVRYPTFVEDTAAAIAWVKAHVPNGGRIYLVGHSAGAYNVMMTVGLGLTKPEDITGIVGLAGPYDFLPLTDPKLQKIFVQKNMRTTQPIYYAKQKFPPVLLMTGDKDTDVKPKNTHNFAAALRASGNEVREVYLPGLDHIDIVSALATPLANNEVLEPIFQFLHKKP